ncbi:hypothetical protein PR048_031855 [Dryococelus australis]|uniref:Uncharacterized protein n=1 Tax=Dryococelus australis TaxID=614101 RepID=A0ABQ9G943_9NEOP|nr:hypothetical protein PR048_031855 [Dryococelus australis]
MEHWDEDDTDTTALEWFNDFVRQKKIDPVTFYTNFIRIQSCMMKINECIIQGPTNAASEIPPLKFRTFVYQFNTQTEHQTLSGLSIRKPPTILQPQHLYTHMLYHINEINEELATDK